eukprot:TRINITY_DN3986_c0_g1_i1.p1 TRINITY_DN3986_c0_g1~~TRINITY_DN3986_c0_g1_i1.p1  ORF type:complete len:65 (+),score=5.04 TRINITY_DN3986_c0_g1_i1:160-354(+)
MRYETFSHFCEISYPHTKKLPSRCAIVLDFFLKFLMCGSYTGDVIARTTTLPLHHLPPLALVFG